MRTDYRKEIGGILREIKLSPTDLAAELFTLYGVKIHPVTIRRIRNGKSNPHNKEHIGAIRQYYQEHHGKFHTPEVANWQMQMLTVLKSLDKHIAELAHTRGK